MPSRPSSQSVAGVLIVGGGYAGLHAARAATQRDAAVTVLDPTGRHDFVTRLAAVAGKTAPRRDASRSLVSFGHPTITGRVVRVTDGSVELDDGRSLVADAVVVCTGSAPTEPDIDGIEHARDLRSADDALALRDELEAADAITIIGGGATGVQLAGAVSASEVVGTVRLVEAESRLLSTMAESSSEGAARILLDRGVDVRTGASVERITRTGAVVDGESLRGLVVWAGGFTPRSDGVDAPLADDGRVVVDEFLTVSGMHRTFAAGDVAAHVDGDGEPLPMSAQVAVQAGEAAGANAARRVAGRDLEAASLSHRGWVLDLSGQRGIAEIAGVTLSAPFADLVPPLLHELIDLKTLFGMGGFSAITY